jgi:hypothetical protein
MFWTMGNSPVWAPEDEGAGAAPDASAAPADVSATMYPDDKPAGAEAATSDASTDAATATPATTDKAADVIDPDKPAGDDKPKTEDKAGDWKPYENDPAKSDEENAAAKLENDLKHPVNQVPEDGKYSLTMPDGIELDTELMDALGPTMAELKLSNGHAQQLVDKYIEAQTAREAKRAEDWTQTINGWADEAKADPDIGGNKFDATLANAKSALTRFGTPELNSYLETSGAGNHPEVIRLMAKVGAMIGEDNPAINDNPGKGAEVDPARVMYPDDKPKGN